MSNATINAKQADTDVNHFIPKSNETKVYELGEAILNVISKNDLDEFIQNTLPKLVKLSTAKRKVSKK